MPDAKLTPEGSVAALGDLVRSLPSNARVLDCSSGTGPLAVGLARLGLDVVATDASAGMVRRTQELADEPSVPLRALRVAWDDLPDYLDPSTFDLVILRRRLALSRSGHVRSLGCIGGDVTATEPAGTPGAHLTHVGALARWRHSD